MTPSLAPARLRTIAGFAARNDVAFIVIIHPRDEEGEDRVNNSSPVFAHAHTGGGHIEASGDNKRWPEDPDDTNLHQFDDHLRNARLPGEERCDQHWSGKGMSEDSG